MPLKPCKKYTLTFKIGCVQPILKKPDHNPAQSCKYRLISRLPFISKIFEKIVCQQLLKVLNSHNTYNKFQSGFHLQHSRETALILMRADIGEHSILIPPDLTAAFVTVGHSILIEGLHKLVGISGSGLNWFQYYFSNRSFHVILCSISSTSAPMLCGACKRLHLRSHTLFNLYVTPRQSTTVFPTTVTQMTYSYIHQTN